MDRLRNAAVKKSESTTADRSGGLALVRPSRSQLGGTLLRPLFQGFLVTAIVLFAWSTGASAAHTKPKAKTCVSAGWLADHPKTVAFASSHSPLLALLAKDPAAAAAVGKNPDAANIAAAEKAFGAAGLGELAKYKTELATLVQPYAKQVSCLLTHPNNRIVRAG